MEPWLAQLAGGHYETAWDLFITRYRPLVLASIRRVVHDPDDVMEVFSHVCQALSADQLGRLRKYRDSAAGGVVATWLVVVIRNLTVDWLRKEHGRQRQRVPDGLSALQQQIYAAVFLKHCSHVEAFELVRSQGAALRFGEFLREVRALYRFAPAAGKRRASLHSAEPAESPDPAVSAESARHVAGLLAKLPPDVRLAVELFVVDGVPADEVARTVGWSNSKAVYNRVYRTLAAFRSELEREGIGRADL